MNGTTAIQYRCLMAGWWPSGRTSRLAFADNAGSSDASPQPSGRLSFPIETPKGPTSPVITAGTNARNTCRPLHATTPDSGWRHSSASARTGAANDESPATSQGTGRRRFSQPRALCKPVGAKQIDGHCMHAWRCTTSGQGSTCCPSDGVIGNDSVSKTVPTLRQVVPAGMELLQAVTSRRGRYAPNSAFLSLIATTAVVKGIRCQRTWIHDGIPAE